MKNYIILFLIVCFLYVSHTKRHSMIVRDASGKNYSIPVTSLYIPRHELMEFGIWGEYFLPYEGERIIISRNLSRFPGQFKMGDSSDLKNPLKEAKPAVVVCFAQQQCE